MRHRFAHLLLFFLPSTLLIGEKALFHLGSIPVYWFEALLVVFVTLTWPEIKKEGIGRLLCLPAVIRWGALLMLPALAISVAVSQVPQDALGAAKSWFIAPMLLAVLIVASGIGVESLIFGVVIGALLQTAYGLQVLPDQVEPRLMGTFTSPNFYAAVVTPAIFLAFLIPTKGKWLAITVLIWGLILSQSLGGFLGLVGGGIYLVISLVKAKRTRFIIGILTVLVGLLGAGIAKQRFVDNPRSSLASRQEIWRVAWKIGSKHPITGTGLRSFDRVYLTTVGTIVGNPIEWNVPEPHNLYLAFWLDLSLIGLIAMLLIIGGTLAQGGAAAAALIAILVHGLVDTPIFKLELAVLFWLYIAIILSLRGRRDRDLIV